MMKKWLFMSVALVCALFTFSACGDDDEEGFDPSKVNTDIVEKGNTASCSISYGTYAETTEFTFDGDKVVKCIQKSTYPSADAAKIVFEEYKNHMPENELALYKLDGNIITYDMTDEWKDRSKTEAMQYLQWMKEEAQHFAEEEAKRQ